MPQMEMRFKTMTEDWQKRLEQLSFTQQAQVKDFMAHLSQQEQAKTREVKQGELYWLQIEKTDVEHISGRPADLEHPYVILQDDLLNQSRLNTTVACALTSNLKRQNEPGNILLPAGEGDLPKASVIVVSQVVSVHVGQLGPYIGQLTRQRMQQLFNAIRFQQRNTRRT